MKPIRKSLYLTVASTFIAVLGLSVAQAGTPSMSVEPILTSVSNVCALGKITKLERAWGAGNTIRVTTESMPSQGTYRADPTKGNVIEMNFENVAAEGGADRLQLLQAALANKLPVQIVSSDFTCMGSHKKFDIALCSDTAECSRKR